MEKITVDAERLSIVMQVLQRAVGETPDALSVQPKTLEEISEDVFGESYAPINASGTVEISKKRLTRLLGMLDSISWTFSAGIIHEYYPDAREAGIALAEEHDVEAYKPETVSVPISELEEALNRYFEIAHQRHEREPFAYDAASFLRRRVKEAQTE